MSYEGINKDNPLHVINHFHLRHYVVAYGLSYNLVLIRMQYKRRIPKNTFYFNYFKNKNLNIVTHNYNNSAVEKDGSYR